MNAQWLLGWWNLVFIGPFGLALIYLGLYCVTGITFGDADAEVDADVDADFEADADADVDADVDPDADVDAEADLDADADADADVDADADADTDADADADADHDADHDHDAESEAHGASGRGSSALGVLSLLGVGKVPLSVLLTVLLLSWGMIGFIVNAVLQAQAKTGPQAAMFSLPIALLGSLLTARGVASLVSRCVPLNETSARRRHELLGSVGQALFPISRQFGLVAVRDVEGNLFQVPCRVGPDADDIAKGTAVRLVGYNARQQIFQVVPAESVAPHAPPEARV